METTYLQPSCTPHLRPTCPRPCAATQYLTAAGSSTITIEQPRKVKTPIPCLPVIFKNWRTRWGSDSCVPLSSKVGSNTAVIDFAYEPAFCSVLSTASTEVDFAFPFPVRKVQEKQEDKRAGSIERKGKEKVEVWNSDLILDMPEGVKKSGLFNIGVRASRPASHPTNSSSPSPSPSGSPSPSSSTSSFSTFTSSKHSSLSSTTSLESQSPRGGEPSNYRQLPTPRTSLQARRLNVPRLGLSILPDPSSSFLKDLSAYCTAVSPNSRLIYTPNSATKHLMSKFSKSIVPSGPVVGDLYGKLVERRRQERLQRFRDGIGGRLQDRRIKRLVQMGLCGVSGRGEPLVRLRLDEQRKKVE
ncbi:hypothetical protein BGZ60DRAFT_432661 [Tricladium varicosporioides]|nr:hypothetical protein BGZ60DRAFT_432661 [Hymenoscyphus varicosporioides]